MHLLVLVEGCFLILFSLDCWTAVIALNDSSVGVDGLGGVDWYSTAAHEMHHRRPDKNFVPWHP
jgi:hypothetical protein